MGDNEHRTPDPPDGWPPGGSDQIFDKVENPGYTDLSDLANLFSSRPAEHGKRSFPGAELLSGGTPRMVLARITPGDPLGLKMRTMARVRERALLIAMDRLYDRSLARTAFAAPQYEGDPPLGEWLTQLIDKGIVDLLREDREAERNQEPLINPTDYRYSHLAEALGVEKQHARKMCIVFNDLPDQVRQVYWAVAVEGKSINRYTAEGHGPPEQIKALFRRAATTISLLRDPGTIGPGDEDDA